MLGRGNSLGEALQFRAAQNLRVHHAYEQRFHRALAKPIHNALRGTASHPLPRFGGLVEKGAVFNRVRQVTFLFEAPQHSANG